MGIDQKFQAGQVVRVINPEGFIASFASKVADRDAVVLQNFLDYDRDGSRVFNGRVQIEFQQRNGRGKKFIEVMDQRYLAIYEGAL